MSAISVVRTWLYRRLARGQGWYYRRVWGMNLGEGVRISRKARLDYTHPAGLHIGAFTIVTPGVQIFIYDFVHACYVDTRIGSCCFIGAGAIILPGVSIGDHCIVGAGAVVTQDVPTRSLVAGNPARIVRSELRTGHYGMLVGDTVS